VSTVRNWVRDPYPSSIDGGVVLGNGIVNLTLDSSTGRLRAFKTRYTYWGDG